MLKHWMTFYRPQRSQLWYWYSTEDAIIADFALQNFTCFLTKIVSNLSLMCVNNHVHWLSVLGSFKLQSCIYLTKVLSKMPKPLIWGFPVTGDTDRFILFHLVHLMTLNISDCMALSEVRLANSGLDRMWKELVMVWSETSGICLDRVVMKTLN
jgi:hypothetical protein